MMMKKFSILAVLLSGTCLCQPVFAVGLNDYYTGAPTEWATITETTKYYDMETGKEVAAEDRAEGKEYKEVVVKEAKVNEFELSLKATEYGKGDSSKNYKWEDGKLVETTETPELVAKYDEASNKRLTNKGEIEEVAQSFVGLEYVAEKSPYGAAIYNNNNDGSDVKIGKISGDFIGNYVKATSESNAQGGAIYNKRGEIGEISGNFIGNESDHVVGRYHDRGNGGAIANKGVIDKISGNFYRNTSHYNGGAIAQISDSGDNVKIGEIDGLFVENTAGDSGGAINIGSGSEVGSIKGTYVGNSTSYSGGAVKINNGVVIGEIAGTYVGNSSYNGGAVSLSGAKGVEGSLIKISGTYVNNKSRENGGAVKITNGGGFDLSGVFVGNTSSRGGAVIVEYNRSEHNNISGDFIGNVADGYGGAIHIYDAEIESISGNFYGNEAIVYGEGGAIYLSYDAKVHSVNGVFVGNKAKDRGGAVRLNQGGYIGEIKDSVFIGNELTRGGYGGAVAVSGSYYGDAIGSTIASIKNTLFMRNTVYGEKAEVKGGAIEANEWGEIGEIVDTSFAGNFATAENEKAQGGAVYIDENATIGKFVNVNFLNNSVEGNENSAGGAIFSHTDLNIEANGKTSLFSGNTANGVSNAIFLKADYVNGEPVETNLNLSAVNNGSITFDDGINGKNYNINISGDGKSVVRFNNLVENVLNFNMLPNAVVHLGRDAKVYAKNLMASDVAVQNVAQLFSTRETAAVSPLITVDVNVNKAENSVSAGEIHVSGDIVGNYRVLVNALNADVLDKKEDAVVPFLFAENDDLGTKSSFEVARVLGSPYLWTGDVKEGEAQADEEAKGSTWYLSLTDVPNPDYEAPEEPEKPTPEEPSDNKPEEPSIGDDTPQTKPSKPAEPVYAPEVAAYAGFLSAAVEQNRSIAGSVANGLAYRKSLNCYQESCGVAESMPKRQAWIDTTHENAKIDAPADMDAKINGVTLGLDLYRDGAHRAGLFGAYRHGKYDLSGKGKYYAAVQSDIRSKSYLGGAYYQYDNTDFRMTGTVFAGNQDMDITTKDGIARADSDVAQYGASVELARRYELGESWNIEPSVGLYYTMLDADDLEDNVGKNAHFEDLQYLEAEAGVKLEREVCDEGKTSRLYVKPSVIRTLSRGGKVKISGLDKARSVKDATLGRVELGGDLGLSESWNGYAHTGYTFGEDYKAYDFTLGLGYKF